MLVGAPCHPIMGFPDTESIVTAFRMWTDDHVSKLPVDLDSYRNIM